MNDLNLQGSHAKYANVRVWEKTIEEKPMDKKINRRVFCSMLLAAPFLARA